MRKFRGIIYRLGFRPKLGSIFHSPSLSLILADVSFSETFKQTLQKQIKENQDV
jgi:hypothetical protein